MEIKAELLKSNIELLHNREKEFAKLVYGLSENELNKLVQDNELLLKQHNFLILAVVKVKKYQEIENELGVGKKILSTWWNELKETR